MVRQGVARRGWARPGWARHGGEGTAGGEGNSKSSRGCSSSTCGRMTVSLWTAITLLPPCYRDGRNGVSRILDGRGNVTRVVYGGEPLARIERKDGVNLAVYSDDVGNPRA